MTHKTKVLFKMKGAQFLAAGQVKKSKAILFVMMIAAALVLYFDNVYKAELETLKKELIELNNAKSDEVQSPSNYNLAKEQSFGFFDDIDDSNWKHLQTILAEMVDHQVPENPLQHLPTANGGWEGYFAWYQTVSSTLPTCSRIILKKWWQ